MTIWIVRKHPPHQYGQGHLEAFTIVAKFATRKEAKVFADAKNNHPNAWNLYTVGKVELK